MTQEQALAFLGLNVFDEEDVEDALEEKLFEFKQYFLTKPIISKLFEGQLSKLQKLIDCEIIFGFNEAYVSKSAEIPSFSDVILETIVSFENFRSTCKKEIANAKTGSQLKTEVEILLKGFESYLQAWPMIDPVDETVILAKEPDSMDLLAEIRAINLLGIGQFSQVSINNLEQFPLLLNEWKRVSLLSKKIKEWKKESSIN